MSARRTLAGAAVLAALTLVVTACGGSEESTSSPTAATVPVLPAPADAELVQVGRMAITDLGTGWRSAGPVDVPASNPCPIAPLESLPASARGLSDRFLEDPAPAAGAPMSLLQRVFVLPTLADADAAFDGELAQDHLDCMGKLLASALQTLVEGQGTVEAGTWSPLDWPATGDRTTGLGIDLTIHSTTNDQAIPVTFASVITQRGRGLTVLELSWVRSDVPQRPIANALAAAVARLAPARSAPDDHAA